MLIEHENLITLESSRYLLCASFVKNCKGCTARVTRPSDKEIILIESLFVWRLCCFDEFLSRGNTDVLLSEQVTITDLITLCFRGSLKLAGPRLARL